MKERSPFSISIKITALILSVLTAVMSLPVYVFSAEFRNEIEALTDTPSFPDALSSEDVAENGYTARVTSLEDDLYSYVFSKYDGTYECLTYDYPVKYYDSDNQLQDKSNVFKATETKDGIAYIPESNDIKTVVPGTLSSGISLEYRDINVRMVYAGNAEKEYTGASVASLSEDKRSVSYAISDKSSLDYALTYNGFKEEIVLSSYEGVSSWSFYLYTGGLALAQNESGKFNLVDSENEIVVNIGRVIVFTADEKNNCLGEMSAETIEKNNLYIVTIRLDEEYLTSQNTTYPIRIDPSLEIAKSVSGAGAIKDITVSNGNTYTESDTYLLVGTNASHYKYRAIVGFPNLYSSIAGKNIVAASFELRDLMCESQHIEIECRRYKGNSWINNSSFTWSGMGSYPCGELLDSRIVSYNNGNVYGAKQRYSWDITSLVQDWAEGKYSPSYGIILKATDEYENGSTTGYKTFASYNRSSKQPSLRYSWVEPNGINSSYEFNTRQIANGISVYENIYFGNITLLHSLNIPTLNEFPLSTNLVYNSSYGNTEFYDKYGLSSLDYGSFGYGVKPAFIELLTVVNDSYGDPSQYSYIDGNGTEFYFTYNRPENNFICNAIDATVTRNSDGSTKLEADGITRNFNSVGLITSVTVTNEDEETATYVYNYSSNKLTSITKNGKTLVSLIYSGSALSSITFPVVISGTAYTNSINFTYSGGRLHSVSDIYGNITDYTFTVSSGNTVSSLNVYDRLSQTGAQYSFNGTGKITSVSEYRIDEDTNGARTNILVTDISRSGYRVDYSETDTCGRKTSYIYKRGPKLVNIIVSNIDETVIYSADYYYDGDDKESGYVSSFGDGNLIAGEPVSTNGTQVYLRAGVYTFSAYANCDNLHRNNAANAGGLYLWVKNSGGSIISSSTPLADVPEGTGYVRLVTTFEITAAGNYTVGYSTANTTGTFSAEGFMLENGSEPTVFNYLRDGTVNLEWYGEDSVTLTSPQALNGAENGRFVISGFLDSEDEIGDEYVYIDVCLSGNNSGYCYTCPFNVTTDGLQYMCYVLPEEFSTKVATAQSLTLYFYNDSEYDVTLSHLLLTYEVDYYTIAEDNPETPVSEDEGIVAEEDDPFVTEYTYDNSGNITSTTVRYCGENTSGQGLLFSEAEYDQNGFITSYTDDNGTRTDYIYNRDGEITESRLYTGASSYIPTYYTYYSNGLVKEITCDGKSNEYVYLNGQLSQVKHKNGSAVFETYTYSYDDYGNVTNVRVGNRLLESYSYTDVRRGTVGTMTYGNGDYETYTYDGNGNVIGKLINGETKYVWSYSIDGTLLRSDDFENGTTEITYTDENGIAVLTKSYGFQSGVVPVICNGCKEVALPDADWEATYSLAEHTDEYGRTNGEIIQRTVNSYTDDRIIRWLTYPSNGQYSSGQIAYEEFSDGAYDGNTSDTVLYYTYDSRGNITGIAEENSDDCGYVQKFYYDNLSQLIREDNEKAGTTVVYNYDCNGNITEKKTYSYRPNVATENLGTDFTEISYSYTNSDWRDLLTAIGNKDLNPDESGNPQNWTGTNSVLSWTGKTLDSYSPDGQTQIGYKYNADGLRTQKTVVDETGSTVYDYYYDGNNLAREIRTIKEGNTVTDVVVFDYIYLDGQLQGFRQYRSTGSTVDYTDYNDYFYGYTQNGEIRLIYDDDGGIVARYSYDAWGNVISIYGNYANPVGTDNAIRYKGYYYDTESEWYYLQSRYYDPEVGRFISADSVEYLGASGTIIGFNLYSYCENTPVTLNDANGKRLLPHLVAIGIQVEVGLGALSFGIEIIIAGRNIYMFGYGAGSFANGYSNILSYAINNFSKFFIKSGFKQIGKLFSGGYISVCVFAIFSFKASTFQPSKYKGWFLGISITIPTIYGVSIKTYTSTYDIYTAVGVGFSYPSSVGIFATASYYLYAGSITLPQSFVSRLRKETQGLNP